MLGFAAVITISQVSVADKAKGDDFDLLPSLDLACDLFDFLVSLKMLVESF